MKPSLYISPTLNSEKLRISRPCTEEDYCSSTNKTQQQWYDFPLELRTRSCQTAYRESDSQTLPWFPPYKTYQTKPPEVVTFSTLPFENTCLDQHDIEIVQRSRKILEWEKYLASIPPKHAKLRNTIINKIENDKWSFREKEYDEENRRRLEKAHQQLEEQRAIVQERIQWRTKRVQEKWDKKKNIQLPQIKSRLDRDLRRINLIRSKTHYPDKVKSNDIMDDYYSGVLNLPPARLGRDPKRSCEVLCKSAFPTSMRDAYLMLETTLAPKKKRQISVRKTRITKHDCDKQTYLKEPEILQNPFHLHEPKSADKQGLETLESLIKGTPEEHQFLKDIKLIQCLIRGRAVQNMMIRQYQANIGLLKEQGFYAGDKELVEAKRNIQEQLCKHFASLNMKDKIDSVIGQLKGQTISSALDFSAKELMRLEEQRRLHVLAQVAEKDRWAREAAEAGRRQEEEQRQRQHEEIYKEVIKMHELSSDVLMNEILEEQIDDTGKGLATIWTRKAADVYDEVIPKPCTDEYKKLEYVSLFVDRCLVTQSENDNLNHQQNQKEVKLKTVTNDVLSEIKKDIQEDFSTESTETVESEETEKQFKETELNETVQFYQNDTISDDENKSGVLNLTVENDNSSELIIRDYELNNIDKKVVKKLLEYSFRKESSESELDENDVLISIAAGDRKALRKHLCKKEKELLKRFVEKPNLLFQKPQVLNKYVEDSEKETDSSLELDRERASGKRHRSTVIETEEAFEQKCLEKKAEKVLDQVLKVAEGYIDKYQKASKKDGFSLELLQKSYTDTMIEAYRILSVLLLKSSDNKNKTFLEKVLKPWINLILNEATTRIRNMFSSLAVDEHDEHIPEELGTEEEELIEPGEIDQMIAEAAVPNKLAGTDEAIPGNHIFDEKQFYCCSEEENENTEEAREVETEIESDFDDDQPLKYLGVLDEKITENLVPDDKRLNKLLRVTKPKSFNSMN